jgi:GntR family transcriptional regulator
VKPLITFRVDVGSGVPPYLQLVRQVRGALQLGLLEIGDQLPTVKEVVGQVAINPNTVLKAYRTLEHEGLVEGRPGLGTFVTRSLDRIEPGTQRLLARGIDRWVAKARAIGLLDDDIRALFEQALRREREEGVA